MIQPTRGAALAAAAGVPVTLVVAVLSPGRWYLALAWPAAVLLLVMADALVGPRRGTARLAMPATAPVGATVDLMVEVRIGGAVRAAEVAVAADPLLAMANDGRRWLVLERGRGAGPLPVTTRRRGTARIAALWVRWPGRLGLVWHQHACATDARLPILPDVRPVRSGGAALFQRNALDGLVAQPDRGDGREFDALVEFRPGMDRRAIDWKQSARHLRLEAKHYRPERNNQIVLAIDTGRQMGEPVGGVPRLDRAITAALLVGWVALKLGDRVALEAFDDQPRLATGFVGGTRAFATLQGHAAAIAYGAGESNHVLALVELAARLTRRSTIMLFTEITDAVSADALVRAARQLARSHLLLVIVLRDEELETIVARRPAMADDVTRAITAAGLLRDRRLVLTRLRRLGARIVEADHDRVGDRLVAAYAALKREGIA